VRWDNLRSIDPDGKTDAPGTAAATLPLGLPGAVVRTFDTPEFRGMTFYEVRAKSIINRVPGASRVPFEWTVNPYRGCGHACVYCLTGDTLVLMADSRPKPLAELRVGDLVYGTVRTGSYPRLVVTQVLAHWQSVKPAYRVTLDDGTELVASAEHRFLAERGWKHVTGATSGPGRRPHLSVGTALIGVGRFAPGPAGGAGYRRGYLCGAARRAPASPTGYEPAVVDAEAVTRWRDYLAGFGIPARAATAARRDERAAVAVADLVDRADPTDDDWRKGYLAGAFDADGSYTGGVLRFTATDKETLDRLLACLRALGFDPAVRRTAGTGLAVQVRGGLREHLRFLHLVDPAVRRRWTVTGRPLARDARVRVVAVEQLPVELPMYDITTGTGDFVANGIVSHNCFARGTHTYLDLDAGDDFDRRVVVKVNAGELLRRELARPRWRGETIAMGTNVDCYQRAEGRYRLMPQIIAALRDHANPFSILTKGTLILRDLELLRQAATVTWVGLATSVGFVDERLWRRVEPGTPSPQRRLDVVRRLTDAGFDVTVLMAPILPGLTDTVEAIDATVAAIAAAGAASAVPIGLHLRPGAREWYLAWLARYRPQLLPLYRERYGRGAYLDAGYQRELAARVGAAARRHGLAMGSAAAARRPPPDPAPKPAPRDEPEQLTLL
jgi:DNA repair photolyase